MDGHGTIYAICNHSTGEAYIGRTTLRLAQRWRKHRWQLRTGRHGNRALQHAYDRAGAASFGLLVLERGMTRCRCEKGKHSPETCAEARWIERARSAGVVLYNDQAGRRRAA